ALERWVLARNPDLEAARRALEAARRRPSFEGALENPELGVAIGPSALGDPQFGTAYRVSIEQMIPLGKLGPQADAARAEADAEGASLAALTSELLRQTRQAYVEYVRASAVGQVLDDLRDLAEQFRKTALSRYASGLSGEADPLMADVELSHLD